MADFNKPVSIFNLSKGELTALLKKCFFIIGKDLNKLNSNELAIMIDQVYRYQGKIWVETFESAFTDYAAGEVEIEGFIPTLHPKTIGRIVKGQKEKKFGLNKAKKYIEREFAPSSDADYFNSLICVMDGRKSDAFEQNFPGTQPLREAVYYELGVEEPIIPITWAWGACYRHLLSIGEISEEIKTNNYDTQKELVIHWVRNKYPTAKFQKKLFPSPQGDRLGILSLIPEHL